jgi:hypothetical protein
MVWNWRFGTTVPKFKGQVVRTAWSWKMGPMCSPETSVSNHLTPPNNPEDGKIQVNGGGSFRWRMSLDEQFLTFRSMRIKDRLTLTLIIDPSKRRRLFAKRHDVVSQNKHCVMFAMSDDGVQNYRNRDKTGSVRIALQWGACVCGCEGAWAYACGCACVALLIHHATRMRHSWRLWLQHIFRSCLIRGTIFGNKVTEHKMCVFWFSLRVLSKAFLVLSRIQRDIVTNVKSLHVKNPLFLSVFNETWIFSTDFRKKKTHVGTKLFHADEQMDRQTDMTKVIVAFYNFSIAPKKYFYLYSEIHNAFCVKKIGSYLQSRIKYVGWMFCLFVCLYLCLISYKCQTFRLRFLVWFEDSS